MQRLWAITTLTWKSAFRFRIFWVLAALLLGAVVLLPLLLKHDGTARGFTQILLTYTLGVITTLLGFSTLWLACGTMARDIEEAQMQVVAVKPIPRWQIWLGKWLGIMLLNAALLAVAGTSVYLLLMWRANHLPPEQQELLKKEVFVARATLREPAPSLDAAVDQAFRDAIEKNPVPVSDYEGLRVLIREQFRAQLQEVPPGHLRRWKIEFGWRERLVRNQPVYVRAKFHAATTNATGTFLGIWRIGTPNQTPVYTLTQPSLAPDTFHEFEIPSNAIDADGVLQIDFENRNDTTLLFPLDEGLEVLYREGGFALNYARGLGIILCWLALLASLGLASASFLSFPVAAFFAFSLLLVALSSGTLATVVEEGTTAGLDHEGGVVERSWVDYILLPIFGAILKVVNLAGGFSPVDALSTGRSISWGELGAAFAQVVLLMGGMIAAAGIIVFTRRELATAQGNA